MENTENSSIEIVSANPLLELKENKIPLKELNEKANKYNPKIQKDRLRSASKELLAYKHITKH